VRTLTKAKSRGNASYGAQTSTFRFQERIILQYKARQKLLVFGQFSGKEA